MNEIAPICPICEEGHLESATYTGVLDHSGKALEIVGLECWQCPSCGADPVFPDQARRNHRRYQDARRQADGLLAGSEIEAVRKRLGLTQHQAAVVFGGGQNAFSKYERGEVIQSQAMDRLLRLAANSERNFELLKHWAGLGCLTEKDNSHITTMRTKVVPFRPAASARNQYKKGAETDWHTENVCA